MDIKTTHEISTTESDSPPDAVKIEVLGVTVTVNMHTGHVSVTGADHVIPTEGDNNTLLVHACPSPEPIMKGFFDSSNPFAGLGEEIMPGVRVGGLSDLLGFLGTKSTENHYPFGMG